MPKKRKPDLVNQVITFFQKKLEDASLRDLAFLSAWISVTILLYQFLTTGVKIGLGKAQLTGFWGGVVARPDLPDLEKRVEMLQFFDDPTALAISLFVGYKAVTTDISDIFGLARSMLG